MDYNFADDLMAIRELLGLTQAELASRLGVQQITISRNESGETKPSEALLEQAYGFAFDSGVRMSRLKEMFWLEGIEKEHKLLIHGAKVSIDGRISVSRSRTNNDFGQGFYVGENYEQAISFVAGFKDSSVYFFDFDDSNLRSKEYKVNRDWMLTIAYYRGSLEAYKDHPLIKRLVSESRDCDYIIAPIADNRMFRIINSFIDGEITDEQCKHCLAATNLGNQYVLISERAADQLKMLERCYIPSNERDYYMNLRTDDVRLGDDKVKLARIKYRGKGHYIDEILK